MFTFATLRRHILSINYIARPIVITSKREAIKNLTQEAALSFLMKLFEFTLLIDIRKKLLF